MTTEAKVGVFVIASVLVLGSATYFVRTTQTVRGQVPYTTHLRNAGGLAPGAAVLFGGIKVGQVTAVRPWSEDPTRIEIVFARDVRDSSEPEVDGARGNPQPHDHSGAMITTGSNEARRLSAGGCGSVLGVPQPGRDRRARCESCGIGRCTVKRTPDSRSRR